MTTEPTQETVDLGDSFTIGTDYGATFTMELDWDIPYFSVERGATRFVCRTDYGEVQVDVRVDEGSHVGVFTPGGEFGSEGGIGYDMVFTFTVPSTHSTQKTLEFVLSWVCGIVEPDTVQGTIYRNHEATEPLF